MRYARNMRRLDAEKYREKLTLEYMNAALQRSKKMPALKSLLKKPGPPSKASIVARIKEAAAFNNANPPKQ